MTVYGPSGLVSNLSAQNLTTNKGLPLSDLTPGDKSFSDILTHKGKNFIEEIATSGKNAEMATLASLNGEISEIDHIMKMKDLERTVTLGTETIKKMTEAYKDIIRVMG